MQIRITNARYEFTAKQNEVVSKLSGAMTFGAAAIAVCGIILAVYGAYGAFAILARLHASLRFSRGGIAFLALFLAPGGSLLFMGAHLYGAASHFRNIATTEGRDIDNLMVSLSELLEVYVLQRWLWIVMAMSAALALVITTRVP